MKATFAKILGLLLVLSLVLTGCNLIEVDPVMQADEDIQKTDKSYSKAVATYDDGEVTIGEAMADFNADYNNSYYMYYYYMGYQLTEDDAKSIMQDVLTYHVQDEVVEKHFDEANTLDAAALEAVEEKAKTDYQSAYDEYLKSAEGKTDEAKDASTRVLLKKAGLDYDSVYAGALQEAKVAKMQEIIEGEIAEVTDEELQTAYDEKVAADEESYTKDASSFGSNMATEGTVAYWAPEGYRTVKHILVIPEDSVKTAYTDAETALNDENTKLADLQNELSALNGETAEATDAEATATPEATAEPRSAEEIQADIATSEAALPALEAAVRKAQRECLQNVQAKTAEIYQKLEAGEDFDALVAEYGEDPGMKSEPAMTQGYYVSAASTNWAVNFRDAAMKLQNVGDYTLQPVVSTSGVHIIKYVSDVTPGAASLEDVHDALYEATLTDKKSAHYKETVDAWVAEVNASYDVDTFQAAFAQE